MLLSLLERECVLDSWKSLMNPIGGYLTSWFLIPLSVLSILSVRGLNMVSHYLQRIECGYPRRLTSVTTSQIPTKTSWSYKSECNQVKTIPVGSSDVKEVIKSVWILAFLQVMKTSKGMLKKRVWGNRCQWNVSAFCLLKPSVLFSY